MLLSLFHDCNFITKLMNIFIVEIIVLVRKCRKNSVIQYLLPDRSLLLHGSMLNDSLLIFFMIAT